MINILVIEDEISAQKHLAKLLGEIVPHFHVAATLSTVKDAVKWLASNEHPQLILLDIHLSDGISFDILDQVEVESPIIFITAYDQYAIKAFKTTGIDYLLKPITKDDLKSALDRFEKQHHQEELSLKHLDLWHLMENDKARAYKERFLLKTGNQYTPVLSQDIAYFYRRNELVFGQVFEGAAHVLDHSLNDLQKMLNPQSFFRLSRQILVNVSAIKKLTTFKPGQLKVETEPAFHETILLSQDRSSKLKQALDAP